MKNFENKLSDKEKYSVLDEKDIQAEIEQLVNSEGLSESMKNIYFKLYAGKINPEEAKARIADLIVGRFREKRLPDNAAANEEIRFDREFPRDVVFQEVARNHLINEIIKGAASSLNFGGLKFYSVEPPKKRKKKGEGEDY